MEILKFLFSISSFPGFLFLNSLVGIVGQDFSIPSPHRCHQEIDVTAHEYILPVYVTPRHLFENTSALTILSYTCYVLRWCATPHILHSTTVICCNNTCVSDFEAARQQHTLPLTRTVYWFGTTKVPTCVVASRRYEARDS